MILSATVLTKDQFEAALSSRVNEIVLEYLISPYETVKALVDRIHGARKTAKSALPAAFRKNVREDMALHLKDLKNAGFDGFLVRSLEALAFLKEAGLKGEITSDHQVYAWNSAAVSFLRQQGVCRVTASVEQSFQELLETGIEGEELIVYGRLPMMITANCFYKTTAGCDRKGTNGVLSDRMHHEMTVLRDCRYCMNTVLNHVPLSLLDDRKAVTTLNPAVLRLIFTTESGEETKRILECFEAAFLDGKDARLPDGLPATHGHFRKKIE